MRNVFHTEEFHLKKHVRLDLSCGHRFDDKRTDSLNVMSCMNDVNYIMMHSAGPKEQTEQTNSYTCRSNITKACVKIINLAVFDSLNFLVWTYPNWVNFEQLWASKFHDGWQGKNLKNLNSSVISRFCNYFWGWEALSANK